MGRKCNVEGCQSDSNRPKDVGVTFHKVPPHSDIRPKWLSLCRIPEDKKNVKVIYVCSRHFLRADFCNFKGKKYMLKQGVLPSVFPWDKSKLEAIKAEAKKEKPHGIKEEPNINQNETELDTNIEVKEEIMDDDAIKQEPPETEIQAVENEPKPDLKSNQTTSASSSVFSFTINSKLEALDFNNEWYPAKIVEIDYEENEVLIHFENFSSKYDEWISMNSSRLRPLQENSGLDDSDSKKGIIETFVAGERCLAAWSDSRKFPATITKVLENGTYEVLFDDGFVKNLKAHRISKAVGKTLQSSPLFDPIKSTKQDRREKKRKINVAALFRKRPKLEQSEEKPKKVAQENSVVEQDFLPNEQITPGLTPTPADIENWKPSWYKGKPVGIESTLRTQDGPKVSYIVPDPRLPSGWNKHLVRRTKGCDAGKWDTIIVNPDNKRFRSKTDVLKYLEEHPNEGLTEKMFDFSLVLKRKRKNPPATATSKSPEKEQIQPPPVIPEEPKIEPQELQVKEEVEEENSNSLKILFEGDAYKCPIEGCGKNFRRENLAQMHVKHYHPEYTKFLDSTPNVADLAYARTVGESLDRSPGPQKPPPLKPTIKTTPKTPKHSGIEEIPELKPVVKNKNKDSEIIKLLNTKPFNKQDNDDLFGKSPTSPYPDIKLKDLLSKSEGIPKREDLLGKGLQKSKPAGIKTLLPGHRPPSEGFSGDRLSEDYIKQTKRKRGHADHNDATKNREYDQKSTPVTSVLTPSSIPLPLNVTQPQLVSVSQTTPSCSYIQSSPLPSLPSVTPSKVLDIQPPDSVKPPDNIIIEGGEIIKIVRMKQEEIINCTCGFMEEDGLMIQCELCLCWQHAYCNNIERESQVPEKYICYICQNPLRERQSRKYYHDQDWLTKGILPVGSYHSKDELTLQKRFEKMKKCHDLSGGLIELGQFTHSLKIKMKIAEAKNHPKLYLWSKPWPKCGLPEKSKPEIEDVKPKIEQEHSDFLKTDFDVEKESQNESSMLMMILKAGKSEMPKLDLNTLMENNSPIIPQPEAVIDSADCRLNLLDHLVHQYSLAEERLDDFEKQIDLLEAGIGLDNEFEYPKTRNTMQMLMRDLDTLKEFSLSSAI